ncbi:hypothetical protein BKA63DRAFT_250812 [Paraphoma chrysanthemicola]|nr:hypothetical protein BKA63DRAFT_250812 [Paraphoma chrysanthemicola]
MKPTLPLSILSSLALNVATITAQQSNLPPPPPGLFTIQASILIPNTTVSAAWHALTNLPAYASWNPFVRRAVVVSALPLNLTLPKQYPVVGANIYFRTQMPPLPFPVDENTPENPLNTQVSYEEIVVVDRKRGLLAWKYVPEELLQAQRWQSVSAHEGGVWYESREVFDGTLAPVVRESFEDGLQKGFEAQAEGLKRLLRGDV